MVFFGGEAAPGAEVRGRGGEGWRPPGTPSVFGARDPAAGGSEVRARGEAPAALCAIFLSQPHRDGS